MTVEPDIEGRSQLRTDRLTRLERMLEIRRLEDVAHDYFSAGKGHGITHTGHGQEAVAVGIAAALRPSDTVACTYRGHALGLALGLRPEAVLGEILGRAVGSVGGVGGSMHLSGVDVGMLPTFAIVGAGIPVAAGVGWAAKHFGTDDISAAVFGDGAANIGAFHEGINLAAIWQLPTLFICENNLYGEYTRIQLSTSVADIADRAGSYGIPAHIVDGQEVDEVHAAVSAAAERIRAGQGPEMLEVKTYRYRGHVHSDPGPYRPEGELAAWQQRDPIELFAARLISEGSVTDEQVQVLRTGALERIDRAFEAVLDSPEPGLADMFRHVYA